MKAKKKNKHNSIFISIAIGALVIIVVLSILISNKNLSSDNLISSNNNSLSAVKATVKGDSQYAEINVLPGSFTPIIVQKNIPTKFNLKAEASNLTGCNSRIRISKYGITKSLSVGDNIVEFIPTKTGTFTYTCSMGMISSTITVVDDLNNIDSSVEKSINEAQKTSSGGCSCGG